MSTRRPTVIFGVLAALAAMGDPIEMSAMDRLAEGDLRRRADRQARTPEVPLISDVQRAASPYEGHSRETCVDEACSFHGPMLRKLRRRAARGAK